MTEMLARDDHVVLFDAPTIADAQRNGRWVAGIPVEVRQ